MEHSGGNHSEDSGISRKSMLSSSSSSDEEDECPIYPPEIWELIFGHLSGFQLLRMRLVCRRWRDIITGCPPLMQKLRILLQNKEYEDANGNLFNAEEIDDQFNPIGLLPVPEIEIDFYYIATVDSWWPNVCRKLTHLKIGTSSLELTLLFSMLQQTLNLRSLHLAYVDFEATKELSPEPTFQLDKLQELSLHVVNFCIEKLAAFNLLSTIERLCPRLKALRIRRVHERHLCVDNLRRLLRSLHNTLECIELDDTRMASVLQDLQEMSRLRLKRVSIHLQPTFHWGTCAKFLGSQPLLEDLVVYSKGVDHVIMSDLGRAVPKLKRLTLCSDRNASQDEIINTDFLQLMPNLLYLKIDMGNLQTILLKHGNPHLKELFLERVDIVGFMNYLKRSRQLRSITIRDCILYDETSTGAVFDNLKTLEIGHCTIVSRTMLHILLQQCPLLVELSFSFDDVFDDAVVLMACELLKHLRKLSAVFCPVTDACVEHIIRYGLSLEEFRVSRGRLSDEAVERLRATRDIRVWLNRL